MDENSFTQFTEAVSSYLASVGYEPLPDEADYRNAPVPGHLKEAKRTVPQSRDGDPFALRDECIHGLPKKLVVFVPGTGFDINGTRHGRGGGWYDRFLSHIPDEWILVGVAKKETFWKEPMSKEPWDVPMDWVIVEDSEQKTWQAFKTDAKR